MCGIIGYIGKLNAKNVVIEGLKRLEYRGYDSVGIATIEENIKVYKDKGRVESLDELTKDIKTNICIGHTRWATHGAVNKANSHPHQSNSNRFFIVHNGIVENYKELKSDYLDGYKFYSQTDTEVIVNLIDLFSKQTNTLEAINKTIKLLTGSHTLLILDELNKDRIYFVKNKTPLLIGKNDEGYVLASDILALSGIAGVYFLLPDMSYGYVTKENVVCYDYSNNVIEVKYNDLNDLLVGTDKKGFDWYMLKEINEQPDVINRIVYRYFDGNIPNIDSNIIKTIIKSQKINIVGSGSSMYAGFVGKYFFEKVCRIPSEVFCASELVYSKPLIIGKPCFLFITQSGETADSISVMNRFKEEGYPIIVISNSQLSTMSLLADYSIDMCAGKEISVASTKAYTAEIVMMAVLANAIKNENLVLKKELQNVALMMKETLENANVYASFADMLSNSKSIFYIGRGIDYWVCLESALKMKEISYIYTEAYSSGELKHGAIALIDEKSTVIAICTQEGTNSITRSNLEEAKARGANTLIISTKSLSKKEDDIILPDVPNYLTPLLTSLVTQCLAYYTAISLGNDVDKPRNLAKSVTVE